MQKQCKLCICITYVRMYYAYASLSTADRVAQQGSKHTGTGHTHTLHCMGTPQTCRLLLHISCLVCTSCAGSPVLQCAIAIRLRGDWLCMQYWICPSHTSLYTNSSMLFTEKDPLSTDDSNCIVHRPNLTDWPSLSGQNLTMVPFEVNGVKFCIHLT